MSKLPESRRVEALESIAESMAIVATFIARMERVEAERELRNAPRGEHEPAANAPAAPVAASAPAAPVAASAPAAPDLATFHSGTAAARDAAPLDTTDTTDHT
jgi:hypothetical protein